MRRLGLDGVAIYEALLTLALGAGLSFVSQPWLGAITWIVGGLLVLNRATLLKGFRDLVNEYRTYVDGRLSQYDGLAEIVDINFGQRQQALREFNDLFFRITEGDFDPLRQKIVGEAAAELAMLADQKRSNSLVTGEYYNWLLPGVRSAERGSNIWAVSMLLDCEFDDSPEEIEWLKVHLQAIERGVIVDRVFVVAEAERENFPWIPAVRAQIGAAGGTHIRYVVKERLRRLDPDLLSRLSDGFIAFDRRVIMIDEHSENGTARGYVSKSATLIRRCRDDFETLLAYSSPCDIPNG